MWSRVLRGSGPDFVWPSARQGHTFTAVSAHKIVLFGGQDANGTLFNDVHVYDLGTVCMRVTSFLHGCCACVADMARRRVGAVYISQHSAAKAISLETNISTRSTAAATAWSLLCVPTSYFWQAAAVGTQCSPHM